MEVSKTLDHISHAVVGAHEAIEMGISDSPEFYQLLSDALYTDKPLAAVRETLCNAWDAHIMGGCTDKPIEITLTSDALIIKDFGPGIARDMIRPIYGIYGKSTKVADKRQTGGFGLGCKAPFAYTDHFEVTSCHGGTKTIYRMTRSAAQLNGKPSIIPVVEVPTTETGLTVKINLKTPKDLHRFEELVNRLVLHGEIKATLNGSPMITLPFSTYEGPSVFMARAMFGSGTTNILVRVGNVIYPLTTAPEYEDQMNRVTTLLRRFNTNSYNSYASHSDWICVLQAEPGSITLVPSREALSLTPSTIKTVTKLLDATVSDKVIEKLPIEHALIKTLKARSASKMPSDSHSREVSFSCASVWPKNEVAQALTTAKVLTKRTDMAMANLLNRIQSGNVESLRFKQIERNERFRNLVVQKLIRADDLKKYMRALRKHEIAPRTYTKATFNQRRKKSPWFAQVFMKELRKKAAKQNLDMAPFQLLIHHYSNDGLRPLVKTGLDMDINELLPLLHKQVILTHSKIGATERVLAYTEYKQGVRPVLVYQVPRKTGAVDHAKAALLKMGYKVVDVTEVKEWEDERFQRVKVTGPRAKVDRKIGVPKLSAFTEKPSGNTDFMVELGSIGNEHRTSNPTMVLKVSTGINKDITDFPKRRMANLRRHFGDQVGIVTTQPSYEKLRKAGVPNVLQYLGKMFIDMVEKQDPQLVEAFSTQMSMFHLKGGNPQLAAMIYSDAKLIKHFNLKPIVKNTLARDLMLIITSYDSTDLRDVDGLQKALDKARKWGIRKDLIELRDRMTLSSFLDLVVVDDIPHFFELNKKNEPYREVLRTLVINALKKA